MCVCMCAHVHIGIGVSVSACMCHIQKKSFGVCIRISTMTYTILVGYVNTSTLSPLSRPVHACLP